MYFFTCANIYRFQTAAFFFDGFFLPQKPVILFLTYQPDLISNLPKPQVCIILPQKKAVLRPGSHHPIRLPVFFGHQIINQHTDVSLRTIQYHRLSSHNFHGRIDTGHKSLYCCLLITGASVKLSSGKKPPDLFEFQRCLQLQRIDAVILNGICIPDNLYILQSRHCPVHGVLHILRQRTGHAAQIHFIGIKSLRLHKNLMPFLIWKFYHLVLDGRTIPGACSLDHAGKKR